MKKIEIGLNILGLIVALVGVFIEPTWVRFTIVGVGTFLSSIRINY